MIPIVISTYPENGSKDMELNSPIKITFADSVDAATINSDRIKLENLNEGRDIPLAFSYNATTHEVTITPSDNKYGNMLLGLVDYRLTMANISNMEAEAMQGLHILEFTTVSDSIEDVLPDPEIVTDIFAMTNFYPKQGSYGISPVAVKIKCNKDVLGSSVTADSFMVTSDPIDDINDIGFVSIDTVAGEYEVSGGIISFKPYIESSNTLGSGAILTGGALLSTFQLAQYPVYKATISVAGVEVIVDVDYTIDLNTGAITFLEGHEPTDGQIVSSVTRRWTELDDNTKYTVVISGIKNVTETETLGPDMYSFYTEVSPLYATINDLRIGYNSISIITSKMNPIDVLQIIRDNSLSAEWIAEQNDITDIDWDNPPKYVVEYVRAKTRYDIVFDRYIQLTSEATSKTLGDLAVEYTMSLSDLLALAEKLKLNYQYWETMIKGNTVGRSLPKPFVRGENVDESPDFMTRQLKDWDGTKSW